MSAAQIPPPAPDAASLHVRLPRNSTRVQRYLAFCKVLTSISRHSPFGVGYEGRIYKPGAVIPVSDLGRGVVLENVGAVSGTRRPHPHTWILWQWDFRWQEWNELARCDAIGTEWAEQFYAPAFRALNPNPQLFDLLKHSRELADSILAAVDRQLEAELDPIKSHVWALVYHQAAGRIAMTQ